MVASAAPSARLSTLAALAAVVALPSFGCAAAQTLPSGINPTVVEITKTEHPTVFIGEGRLSHDPEFIEFNVTINAECYATPMEASAAADKAAANVISVLGRTVDAKNPRDGVFSKGGYSRPFQRYINNARTLCLGTFAKTVTITAKTSRIREFRAEFSAIQHDLLSSTLQKPDPKLEAGVTYAALAEPVPHLFYETRERLEQEALADALANARQKFETTAKSGCGNDDYGILRVVERDLNGGRPIAYAAVEVPRAAEGAELDAIWINKTLEVSFLTAPGRCVVK